MVALPICLLVQMSACRPVDAMRQFFWVLVQVQGVEIEGEMRAHKIWIAELTDDDRATRIYEMGRPVSTVFCLL